MTITVFGATSSLGLEVIKQALAKNYIVKAFGRDVSSLIDRDLHTKNFEAIKGYVFDEKEVANAIENTDVVISCLGGGVDGTDRTRSLGSKNIIRQMQNKDIRRIIIVSNACILNGADEKFIFELDDYPEELKPFAQEHYLVFTQLQESNLDWTVFCPEKIINSDITSPYQLTKNILPDNTMKSISSSNLAACMLSSIGDSDFFGNRFGLCNNN